MFKPQHQWMSNALNKDNDTLRVLSINPLRLFYRVHFHNYRVGSNSINHEIFAWRQAFTWRVTILTTGINKTLLLLDKTQGCCSVQRKTWLTFWYLLDQFGICPFALWLVGDQIAAGLFMLMLLMTTWTRGEGEFSRVLPNVASKTKTWLCMLHLPKSISTHHRATGKQIKVEFFSKNLKHHVVKWRLHNNIKRRIPLERYGGVRALLPLGLDSYHHSGGNESPSLLR